MGFIKFSKDEKDSIVRKIQVYFGEGLNQKIGGFDAEFLMDFFSEEIGAYYYNRGLADAQSMLEEKMQTMTDALYELEKPVEFSR